MEPAKTTLEELSGTRRRLMIEVAAPAVQAELDRAFGLVGRNARLPGFRPGKAPRHVLERMFGDQVRREVLGKLVEESFHHAVHEHNLSVVGYPEIDADSLTPGEPLRYSATIDVRPEIALGDVAGMEVARAEAEVTDESVDAVLAQLRDAVAQLRPVDDRAVVEAGDVVTVNLTTRLENAEPVSREGVLLEAGAGTFPLALERQLVGQHRGARLTLEVPYPDDHQNPTLAGRTASFDVELLDIRVKELPPLDDDFARDHGRSESLPELRDKIRDDLRRQAQERADAAVRESLLEQLSARHPFEVPRSLVQRRAETILAMSDLRIPPDVNRDEMMARLTEQLAPRAEHEVRMEMLLDAVAAREQILPGDEDVDEEIARIAARESQAPERVRSMYGRPEMRAVLRGQIARRRALERLVEHARIVPAAGGPDIARENQSR